MYKTLTKKLSSIFDTLRLRGKLTEHDISKALDEMESVFIESDVAISVVEKIKKSIYDKAIGEKIYKSVSAVDQVIKIVYDEIVNILSVENSSNFLDLKKGKTKNILLVGLQGSGKTSFIAKLANYYMSQDNNKKDKKKILTVSLDVYRPAAKEQLKILSDSIGVDSLDIIENEDVYSIVKRAINISDQYDIVLYDSAGRMEIDKVLINELKKIKEVIKPQETLLVLDSLTGQSSFNIAKHFHSNLSITGNLLSKMDGDSKGGASLSLCDITSRPILFIGTGEKVDDIEIFDPKKMADRILDKGDILALVDKAKSVISEEETKDTMQKMKSGNFDLTDYLVQLKQLSKMGGMSSIISMIPGFSKFSEKIQNSSFNDNSFKIQESIINSMTLKERVNPNILNNSRKIRIAKGSGRTVSDVNKLISQFNKMLKMFKKAGNMDMSQLMGGNFSDLFKG